jgi:hypothetical protein
MSKRKRLQIISQLKHYIRRLERTKHPANMAAVKKECLAALRKIVAEHKSALDSDDKADRRRAMNIYVASSWRNTLQPEVVARLRDAGHEVYDFRNPHTDNYGFHWSELDPAWNYWSMQQFKDALDHPTAVKGFELDWRAMCSADTCVMVMPCGRSAHLEAGYFCGAGKPLIILLSDGVPELMYKMADCLCTDIDEVLHSLDCINRSESLLA